MTEAYHTSVYGDEPWSDDEITRYTKSTMDGFLERGETESYVEGWADLQRAFVADETPPEAYLRELPRARKIITEPDRWQKILRDVASGEPSSDNLQIVTFAAQPLRPELQMHPQPLRYRALGRLGLNDTPVLDMLRGGQTADEWRALHGYALRRSGGKEHYNAPSGHLLAVAQTDLIRNSRLLPKLDVTNPDPLLLALSRQLSVYVGQGKSSGMLKGTQLPVDEVGPIPKDVEFLVRAMEQFDEDAIRYQHGDNSVVNMQGRLWRFLETWDGQDIYVQHLGDRARARFHSDEMLGRYSRCFIPMLDKQISWQLEDLAETSAYTGSSKRMIQAHENLGNLWAVVTMRKDEPGMRDVITRYSQEVRQLLEPYVIDGLPLVSQRFDAFWLSAVVLESWFGDNEETSVFSPAYSPVAEDRRKSGEALSNAIRRRLGQPQERTNELGIVIPTHSYPAGAPHVGIVTAYYQFHDLDKRQDVSDWIIDGAERRFWAAVKGAPKDRRASLSIGLPRSVRQAIDLGSLRVVA